MNTNRITMLQNVKVVDRIGENFLVSCEPVCSTVQMFATGSRNSNSSFFESQILKGGPGADSKSSVKILTVQV